MLAILVTGDYTARNVTQGVEMSEVVNGGEVDVDWRDKAGCGKIDTPDLFFSKDDLLIKTAKNVCKGCEVTGNCLQYALDSGESFGVWGGFSKDERRKIIKNLAKSALQSD